MWKRFFFSFYTYTIRLNFVFSLFLLLSGDYYNLYIAIQSDSFNGECLSWHSITRPYCLCHFIYFFLFHFILSYVMSFSLDVKSGGVAVTAALYFYFICRLIVFFFKFVQLFMLFAAVFSQINRKTNVLHTQRHSTRRIKREKKNNICLVHYWQFKCTIDNGHCLVIYKLVLWATSEMRHIVSLTLCMHCFSILHIYYGNDKQ